MQPHDSPQQLHFPPARPPRSDLLPASLIIINGSAPSGFHCASLGGVVPTHSHTRIPFSIPLPLGPIREARVPAFSSRLNILTPGISHSRRTDLTLGIHIWLSDSSTLPSQGYPQVLFEPHLNSHCARSRKATSSRTCVCLRDDSQTRHPAVQVLGFSRVAHVGETTRRCARPCLPRCNHP
jgi:hypothetical protein